MFTVIILLSVLRSTVEANTTSQDNSTDVDGGCDNLNYKEIEMTRAIKDQILRTHNSLRSRIAINYNVGPVSNMKYLNWDVELQNKATSWLQQCSNTGQQNRSLLGEHVSHKLNYSRKTGTAEGQNVGERESIIFPISFAAQIILDWYFEAKNTTKEVLKCMTADGGNNFTQLLWATTDRIGCAANRFELEKTQGYRMVCNYRPGGNVVGASAYLVGVPCSRCSGLRCNDIYDGLCGKSDFSYSASNRVFPLRFGFVFFLSSLCVRFVWS